MKKIIVIVCALALLAGGYFAGRLEAIYSAELLEVTDSGYMIQHGARVDYYEY